jgi:hypothetical protein
VTAGAPASIEVLRLRLVLIHLQATVKTEGLDLALAQLCLPQDAEQAEVHRALVKSEATPKFEAPALARRRVEEVQANLKRAGIDTARLLTAAASYGSEARDGRVDVTVAEPDSSRRRGILDRLRDLGATIMGSAPPRH